MKWRERRTGEKSRRAARTPPCATGGLRADWLVILTAQKRQRDCRTPNDSRTSSAGGDGGGAWGCGRTGEFDWRIFCGAAGLAAAGPALLHGAWSWLHAGRGVHGRDSGIRADWRAERIFVGADRIFRGAFVRAHSCAAFLFWGRDAHGDDAI